MEWILINSYHGLTRIVRLVNRAAMLVLPLLLVACGGGAGGGIEANTPASSSSSLSPVTTSPDKTSPVITITAPTSGASFNTTSASVTVTGSATDNVGLSQISWTNSKGGSGNMSVNGTSASGSFNIALLSGANVITVTARDTSGNSGQRQLTINYTPTTTNSAILVWDAVIATNLSGYRLYYGTAPRTYLQPFGQGINVGNVTSYTLTGLTAGTRYYFAVTAIDVFGNESGYSNEAFKDVP
jgi:Fibronectin type III domain